MQPNQKTTTTTVQQIDLVEPVVPLTVVTTEETATITLKAPPLTVVTTEETIVKGSTTTTGGDQRITEDGDLDTAEQNRLRTPGALQRIVADSDKKFKSAKRTITSKRVKFDKF